MEVTKFSVTGKPKLFKRTVIVSAPRPVPTTKNDTWH